jgi:AraC family transcriptional regulator
MDLLTRMVEHHIWLTGERIGRARRLPAAELDKPFEVPVDEDQQTLRRCCRLAGQMAMWSCAIASSPTAGRLRSTEDLDVMRGRRRWCWRFNLGSPPSWIGAT